MRERVDLKSPVREYRPPGSVRGAPGNRRPYLDTEGKPKVTEVVPGPEFDDNGLLRFVASLERHSEHPLAAAVVRGAEERRITLAEPERFDSVTGGGAMTCLLGTTDCWNLEGSSAWTLSEPKPSACNWKATR